MSLRRKVPVSTQSRFMCIFFLSLPTSHLYSSEAATVSYGHSATCSSTTTLVSRALAHPQATQRLVAYRYNGSAQTALKERAADQKAQRVQVEDVSHAPAYTVQEPAEEQEAKRSREAELLATQAAIIRQQQQELEEARAALKAAQDEKKHKEEKSAEQLRQEVDDFYTNAANAFEAEKARKAAEAEKAKDQAAVQKAAKKELQRAKGRSWRNS